MITEPILAEAVEKGLLTTGQGDALRSLARQRTDAASSTPEPADEEALRLVSGFADIVVAIGIVLFLGAGAYLLGPFLRGDASAAVVALLAWALAEFFTRRKRMALPSILLLLAFVTAGFVALVHSLGGPAAAGAARLGWLGDLTGLGRGEPLSVAAASLGTAALAVLHYARFRVPITVAAGAGALALATLMLLQVAVPDLAPRSVTWLLCLAGLAIFGLAMRHDLADPERRTRRTDIAFWLHLLAAPLIVHSVFTAIGVAAGPIRPPVAVVVLVIFILLAAVAVLVDRRALLVSGLVYAGAAFGSLVAETGLGGRTVPVTLLILGGFVLLLSAGWTPLRRRVLDRVPETVAARLPRPWAA